jgi:hypothetical protein
MTAGTALHIVFGASAAGSLRQALVSLRREDRVLAPFNDLSFWPIAAGDAVARGRWVEEHLGYADWQDIVLGDAPLLAESLAAERPLVAWVSFREARSYAGLLWWLSRIGDLAEAGALEWRGDLADIHRCELRLPS